MARHIQLCICYSFIHSSIHLLNIYIFTHFIPNGIVGVFWCLSPAYIGQWVGNWLCLGQVTGPSQCPSQIAAAHSTLYVNKLFFFFSTGFWMFLYLLVWWVQFCAWVVMEMSQGFSWGLKIWAAHNVFRGSIPWHLGYNYTHINCRCLHSCGKRGPPMFRTRKTQAETIRG